MHVAVFGAGYAGLGVTRRLEDALPPETRLTLVNDGPDHVVTHEIHRAIRRPAVAEAISVPLEEVVDRAEVVTSPVVELDPEAGVAELASGEELLYDYGAVTFGSETAFYGIDGLEAHAHPLKTLEHAAAIREDALDTIEAAREDGASATADGESSTANGESATANGESSTADGESSTADGAHHVDASTATEPGGRIVVGGAGLSGVQVAGELAALAREEGVTVPDDLQITLVEQLATVAPNFPPNFQRAVRDALTDRGVEVRTETTVVEVDEETVVTDGRDLPYDTLVWTGGIAGRAPTNGERPVVRADLRLTDRTFALGDAARVVDADGEPVPASASAAIREAKTAARNLTRLVEDDGDGFDPRLDRYRFDVPGWLVSVGDGAVAQLGPTVLTGAAAAAVKTSVGAGYLTSVGATRNAVELAEEELS